MGRKKISERCLEVARKHQPKDYTIHYRSSLTGRCCRDGKWLSAPRPVTRRALHVFLHECHHAMNAYSKFPSYYAEYQCEMFATRTMESAGLEVHEKSLADARAYVKRCLEQSVRSGLLAEDVSPEIAAWCGYSQTRMMTNNLPVPDEIKERLKKCLALATSDNENEAELAMAKAREIMQRYNLRTADLTEEGSFTIEQRIIYGSTKSVQHWETCLAASITEAFDGAMLYQRVGNGYKMFFMAAKTDLEIICDLFLRIRPLITKMSAAYVARQRKRRYRPAPITLHNSYRHGVVKNITARLGNLQKATRPEPIKGPGGFGGGTDLIVVKNDAVNDFMNKEHPVVGTARPSRTRLHGEAFDRGHADGNSINLHRSVDGAGVPLAIEVSDSIHIH